MVVYSMVHPEVMTIDGLAEYLRLPQSTLNQLAREGSLPGKKVGGQWQFQREAVDLWLGVSAEDRHHQNQYVGVEATAGLIETFDLDEHVSLVAPFDVQRSQITAGRFHSKFSYVRMPGMVVYEDRWLRQSETYGTTHDDLIMIGTNVNWQRSRIDWCGRAVDHRRFACSAPGAEMDFSTPDLDHHAVMLVQPDLVARSLGQDTVDLLCGRRHVDFRAADGLRLIATITGLVQKYTTSPELLNDPREVTAMESRLLDVLGACIDGREPNDRPERAAYRNASVRRAVEYVKCSPGPVTTQELVVALGVSRRTLEYGFRDVYSLSPAEYLRLHRLNCAHLELADADPHSKTVFDIALNWGFSHPGRFSVAYRKQFGEAPSAVLRRARLSPAARFFDLFPAG